MRTKEWHINHLQELTDQVIDIVENCKDDVPGYMKEHRQAKFEPKAMLPKLSPEELAKARAYTEEYQ